MNQSLMYYFSRLPENKKFISLFDALLNQVEQENHFCRVLQNAGLVITHYVLGLWKRRSGITYYSVVSLTTTTCFK